MVKPGAAVLDVGVSHVDGKLTGESPPVSRRVAVGFPNQAVSADDQGDAGQQRRRKAAERSLENQ